MVAFTAAAFRAFRHFVGWGSPAYARADGHIPHHNSALGCALYARRRSEASFRYAITKNARCRKMASGCTRLHADTQLPPPTLYAAFEGRAPRILLYDARLHDARIRAGRERAIYAKFLLAGILLPDFKRHFYADFCRR